MLVNEIHEYIKQQVEDVDVSLPMQFIREKALSNTARFYPDFQRDSIAAEPKEFISREQAHKLRLEGFEVTEIWSNSAMGGGKYFTGYTVSW